MNQTILQANIEKRGLVFDPRTKLLLLITMAVFVLGGAGGEKLTLLALCLCLLPVLLMAISGRYKTAIIYSLIYLISLLLFNTVSSKTTGVINFILLGTTGIITKFMPSIILGMYVVSTTTVSEFTAAMHRIHMSENIIIPMSVMFRFFPTVADEFLSINAAMRMRGIRLGGKNIGKIIEYRLIPLMSCSVKIGEELSAAALTRGLGGNVKRTNVCKIGFHIQDIIVIFLCAACFAVLISTYFSV